MRTSTVAVLLALRMILRDLDHMGMFGDRSAHDPSRASRRHRGRGGELGVHPCVEHPACRLQPRSISLHAPARNVPVALELLDDFRLAAHGVDRHRAALDVQEFEHLRNRRDLVRLLLAGDLAECQPFSLAHAVTRCKAFNPDFSSKSAPRVLPSMAISASVAQRDASMVEQPEYLLKRFCNFRTASSHDTFQRVFGLLDRQQLAACLFQWTQAIHEATGGKLIAIDGKALRRRSPRSLAKRCCTW